MNRSSGARIDPLQVVEQVRADGTKRGHRQAGGRSPIRMLRDAARYCHYRPWWVTLALCILFDALLRFAVRRPSVEPNARMYAYGLAMTVGLFAWLGVLYRLVGRAVQIVAAVVVALFFFLALSVNYFIYHELGQYLTRSMLQFMGENAFYFKDYPLTYLLRSTTLLGVGFLGALVYLWYPPHSAWRARAPKAASLRDAATRFWFIHLPLAYIAATVYLAPQVSGVLMPVIPSTVWALAISQPPPKAELHYAADRFRVVPVSTDARPPNILIIASESWGKQEGLAFYGQRVDAMPFLSQWIRQDREHFIVWKSGYTSSTATDVSLPSLVTGVEPDETARKLHEMPLLWQWGKASGAYTFYLTSVRQSFGRLDLFFKCKERDAAFGAENIDSPIVHEAGIDDIVTAGKVREILDARPRGARFVGMMFTNALHSPFQAESRMVEQMPAFDDRYQKALYILDKSIERTVATLKDEGVLDNTVIFFTADHGESPVPAHTAHRTFSYYEEFFNIPYLVYVPEHWKASHPAEYSTLRANEIQNVSNLDVLPTVVDLLGLRESNAGVAAQMKGQSLVRAVDPKRILVGLGTNDVRTWEQEGLGLAWGPYRFVCSNVEGPQFFDLVTDPVEQHDRWPSLDSLRKRTVMLMLSRSYHLKRICGMAH